MLLPKPKAEVARTWLVDGLKDSTLDAAAAASDASRCVLSLVLCAARDASLSIRFALSKLNIHTVFCAQL